MDRQDILVFLRRHRLAVQSTVSPDGWPQAAVVGIVVSDDLEIFFDTLTTTRKLRNLRASPRMAMVIGWDEETVQLEGIADEPSGADLERLLALYLQAFPDGKERQAWPGITYVRIRPRWLRYSDFRGAEPVIVELEGAALEQRAGTSSS